NLTEFFDGQQQHSVNNTDSCLYKIDNQHFYFDSKYQASFNGGNDSLYAFIRRELNISIYYNIIPKVYVAFIVDNVGLIKYCGIYRGFDQECDKAVLTLLSKMPNWHPAICDNKTVSSFNILKIDFSIIH
ncbi:MAG: hypothetical protein LBT27_06670, partial [Prevotellaceae bacterium]|nr:hypothetical protein [Prevotellaceae bacterium]